ncbi:hypothetical protein KJ870_07020 [bacterium]|nr:hypothetical protein [bacterium]MBU1434670.1 hypothetical protein [bacterium]MBU1502248.1 hypothetical protein [bacterium]
MQIQSNTYTMNLEELPLDIGYASQKVTMSDINGKECVVGGQNGLTQLFVTAPSLDAAFIEELKSLSEILPKGGAYEVTASLIVANSKHQNPSIEGFDFYIDTQEEFGDFYGVRLKGEPYHDEFTKALILVSKDGAIFYDEFSSNLEDKFNLDTLYRKIAAAQLCYTGKGCH